MTGTAHRTCARRHPTKNKAMHWQNTKIPQTPDATLNEKGFAQYSSATDSDAEDRAATSKAVKIAMDNANARLAKNRNGSDIPNKPLLLKTSD